MGPSLREDRRGGIGAERVAAWVVVALAVAFAAAVAIGPGATLATSAPDASFEGAFDEEANEVSIEHAGGDPLRQGTTSSLVLEVADGQTDAVRTVTWVAEGDRGVGRFPVAPGDAMTVDDATVDADGDGDSFDADATVGFALGGGDEVRVVWRGRLPGAPGETDATLATYRISQ